MLIQWLFTALSATLCTAMYAVDTAMRADVTFNDYNDRFDVGDIINEQNKQFRDFAQPMDYEDTRRHLLADVLKQDRRRHQRSQKHRRYEGSEEDFVQSYQPRMVDDNDELEQYNTNLESFRRQKPPQTMSRRKIGGNKVVVPAIDYVKTKDKLLTREFLQEIMVKEPKLKNARKDKDKITGTENAKVIRYIDTKGRRNNFRQATPKNHESNSNVPKGVILKYVRGGEELSNGRKMAEAKADAETLLNYAVPLRMTVKGYLELPNP